MTLRIPRQATFVKVQTFVSCLIVIIGPASIIWLEVY
jgi:hypothetical protein